MYHDIWGFIEPYISNYLCGFRKYLKDACITIYGDSEFKSCNIYSTYNGSETICYRGPKTWALLPKYIKESKTLSIFKTKIKKWKPKGCACRLCRTYVHSIGFL